MLFIIAPLFSIVTPKVFNTNLFCKKNSIFFFFGQYYRGDRDSQESRSLPGEAACFQTALQAITMLSICGKSMPVLFDLNCLFLSFILEKLRVSFLLRCRNLDNSFLPQCSSGTACRLSSVRLPSPGSSSASYLHRMLSCR